ncbi:FadR/GntR family transcriptional regulator [Hoyosella subflava]|uniref:Putative GntR family transcriptional regulator n=1 Tax=Hoyosella subflava (strain DSM 45089 / JCM 17490 / NBRC 109087 / DQS3-9A1) TaxID=443218 RepID=F6EIZ3_HOYSD|nr:GntR family transcriptional regulator [Hoyosella subflava]AEF40054.1 Putative GntR family transcriptional regulator [Hoyosella subflava DQS3-9A1]
MFEAIARTSTSAAVFDQISARVLSGELAPGDDLPSERRLAEAFGVSRPAIREAIQKLSQAGLVEVRQGDATSVRDYRAHAGPELLPQLLLPQGEPDVAVALSVVEARQIVGVKVAELAAQRVTADQAARLHNAAAAMESPNADTIDLQFRALGFWDAVVDSADSIAFRLIFNSLRSAYEPMITVLAPVMEAEVSNADAYHNLATAIAANDHQLTSTRAEALLSAGTLALSSVLNSIKDAR